MNAASVRIERVEPVGSETIAVDLESPPAFSALPGQFVKLSVTIDGEHIARFYTLSSPTVDETFEVTVGIDPDGTLGPWLRQAEGETVTIDGPYGAAYYEGESKILVLAGGPGIGPAVGIGERAIADRNEITVVYRDSSPVHEDRLEALRDRGATVVITEDDFRLPELFDGHQIYVYGFQDFVSDAIEALESADIDHDEAKIENFG